MGEAVPLASFKPERDPRLDVALESLDFSVRTQAVLKRDGTETVGDLVAKTETDILRTPLLGRKSLSEIKEVLAQMGLRLRG